MRKTSATLKHRCGLCDCNVSNPCEPDLDFPAESLAATKPLPVPMIDVVRAKAKVDLLTRQFFCTTGKELVRRKLTPQEVVGVVNYRLCEGLYHHIEYQWPSGKELVIGPDTIETVFDGRKQLALPADVDSWADEKIAYHRAIYDWLEDAKAGAITEAPGDRWYMKLLLIDLALRTPDLDPQDLD